MYFGGEIRHAVRKSPRFSDDEEVVKAVPVEDDERALAEEILRPFASDLLYARVDLARDAAGAPMVMELELIEPSLFLAQHRGSADVFARAIVEAARKGEISGGRAK